MKKLILSIFMLSLSLTAFANEFHGSLSGMSNAAYATGNYSEGVILNPSLGAYYNPDKDNFSLLIGLGGTLSDKDNLIDQAEDISDIFDTIDYAGLVTQQQASDLLSKLQKIDGDKAVLNAGANIVLSIPNDVVSFAIVANSRAAISIKPDVSDADLKYLSVYVNGDEPGENFETDGFTSTVNGKGVLVTDVGISLSKSFKMNDGSYLLVGVTPKRTEVKSISYIANVSDYDEDDIDADEFTRTERASNMDIGMTYIRGKMHYAVVANNIKSHTFKTIDANEFIEIERKIVSSTGYVSGKLKTEFAIDLNSTASLNMAGESQMWRAGVEYSPWNLLRLRAGIQQDMKNTVSDSYSVGLGLGAFNVSYITGSEETEGFAISGGIRF